MPLLSPLTTVDSNSCESPAPGLEKLYLSEIAKADGQVSANVIDCSTSPIQKLATFNNGSAGDLGVQESTKTDDLDIDMTSTDNISPTSGSQLDVFPILEKTTAVPVNVKSEQPKLTTPVTLEVTNITDAQKAELYMYQLGMCWQVVETNLRPFFHALEDINSMRSLLENAMFPDLLRTFVNKTKDFDEDDYTAFEPLKFIHQEKARLMHLLTSMNTMFYDVLQVYLNNGKFERSVKNLLFFLHKDNRRGSMQFAKNGEKDTEVYLEVYASFGGYEKMLYKAVIAWRKFFFSKSLERSLLFQEELLEKYQLANVEPNIKIPPPNYKESMLFVKRAEHYQNIASLDSMHQKTDGIMMKAWAYEALKDAWNSRILDSDFQLMNENLCEIEKAESFIFSILFPMNLDVKFEF